MKPKKLPKTIYVSYEYGYGPEFVPLMANRQIGQIINPKGETEVGVYVLKEKLIANVESETTPHGVQLIHTRKIA